MVNMLNDWDYYFIVQIPHQMNAGMARQDIESLINTQNSIISSVREIRYVPHLLILQYSIQF